MALSLDLTNVTERPKLANMVPNRKSLIGLAREELKQVLIDIGIPEKQCNMRTSQLWHWLYVRGVSDFSAMKNISKDMRNLLSENFSS